MPGCKLTRSLDTKICSYVAGGLAPGFYLANYYPAVTGAASVAGKIAYQVDTDGYVSSIKLPTDETFFKLEGAENTVSYTDQLLVGANNTKYRQHTLNAVLTQNDIDLLNEADALSLGRYIGIVIDQSGKARLLGRTNGLTAPAGGFDFASGAAIADAAGWTVILQGVSMEAAPIILDDTVITPVFEEVVVP